MKSFNFPVLLMSLCLIVSCANLSRNPDEKLVETLSSLGPAPEATSELAKNPLALKPNTDFFKIKDLLNEAYQLSLESQNAPYPDLNINEYIADLLDFNAYEEARKTTEKITLPWPRIKAEIRLANYLSIHGECRKSETYFDHVLSNPEFKMAYNRTGRKDRADHIIYNLSSLISAMELCGLHARSNELIKGFRGSAIQYAELGLFASNETNEEFLYRQKIEFLVAVYSKIGADLIASGKAGNGQDFIEYATKLILVQENDVKGKAFYPLYFNLLQADLIDQAQELLEQIQGADFDYSEAYYLAQAYALHDKKNEVFGIGEKTRGRLFGLDSRAGMISPQSLYFLTNGRSPAEIASIKKLFIKTPYSNAVNINGYAYLAMAEAAALRKDEAEKSLNLAITQLDKFYPSKHKPEEFKDTIAEAYVLVDGNPYRAFNFLMNKEYFGAVDSPAWGYVIGSAKLNGDRDLLKRIDGILKEKSFYAYKNNLYRSGEVDFYINAGEFDKALTLLREKELEEYRRFLMRKLALKIIGISPEESQYKSNIEHNIH